MLRHLFPLRRSPTRARKRGDDHAAGKPQSAAALSFGNSPLETLATARGFQYTGSNRGDFYRYLRDHIPIVSSGIWTWVHLCATPQRFEIQRADDDETVRRAQQLVDELGRRIYPRMDGDQNGLARLNHSMFMDLFTLGKVALRVHLLPDQTGISHVEALDPFRISWQQNKNGMLQALYEEDDGSVVLLPPETVFHRTLTNDFHMPEGVEPLASIPFVVEIEQRMLADMARASHNSGVQRMQVKMAPPSQQPGEDSETYTKRINQYFDRTIQQFRDLEPDDNVFTWSDVEVKLIGGGGTDGQTWKINREQVIEDVITGMKLFPWALGRSHGTTKNWIYAQYNLLMQIVDSIQQIGVDLAEWLMTLELRLAGNTARPKYHFAPNQDPFIVERNDARLKEVERVEKLVKGGYITRDQGARELGYEGAAIPDDSHPNL